eukprot:jgi/Orpsp1_1/1192912/evm.model.d7180000096875.1
MVSANVADNKSKTTTKRHFPKIKKCICCFCMLPDTSFKVCTSIVMLYYLISLVFNVMLYGFDKSSTYSEIIMGCILKSFYMIQFIIFFAIYLIYVLFNLIAIVLSCIRFNKDSEYHKTMINDIESQSDYNDIIKQYNGKSENYINYNFKIAIITSIIELIIMLYYYLVNCSYIEEMIEFVDHEDEFRQAEEIKH